MFPVQAQTIAAFCAQNLQGKVSNHQSDFEITYLCTLDTLVPGGLAFCNSVFSDSSDGPNLPVRSVLLAPPGSRAANGTIITVDNPRLAFAKVAAKFFVEYPAAGVHSTAVVDSSAQVDPSASVGPYCVIGPRCVIGEGSTLHRHVVLSKDVHVGRHCTLWSHCVLGEDGFGIESDKQGNLFRLPHLGGVKLGDYVHIGNFTAVAAGTIKPTMIGDYSMIDNLVHIAHNVEIGRNCQIIACAEVSGSVKVADGAWIAPNAAIMQKLEIGEDAVVGLGAAVTKSVPARAVVAGVPAKVIKFLGDARNE